MMREHDVSVMKNRSVASVERKQLKQEAQQWALRIWKVALHIMALPRYEREDVLDAIFTREGVPVPHGELPGGSPSEALGERDAELERLERELDEGKLDPEKIRRMEELFAAKGMLTPELGVYLHVLQYELLHGVPIPNKKDLMRAAKECEEQRARRVEAFVSEFMALPPEECLDILNLVMELDNEERKFVYHEPPKLPLARRWSKKAATNRHSPPCDAQ